ncbi:MAG TPA: glutamate-5-semialdehyde dehydrogenase [Victivallales bacterium]|nr:glutamate-5-semialdehyde dehydrogenase [Victivallales bacterium]
MKKNPNTNSLELAMNEMGEKARIASRGLAALNSFTKNSILKAMADAIDKDADLIIAENAKDLNTATEKGIPKPMIERLTLDKKRISSMSAGLRAMIELEDPVGKIISSNIRPNGLKIDKVSVPIGVIAIIYESRPNVTVDSAGLCIKAGNAVILRGGSESFNSNRALLHCINRAALEAGLPEGAIQMPAFTEREAVNIMLKMDKYIDLVIPRGGEGLIRAVAQNSTIPVIKHYKGVCHLFVDSDADTDMAEKIIVNAKCQRPGVCNAIETLLIHKDIAHKFAPKIAKILYDKGVELRGDCEFRKHVPKAIPANEQDWFEEYLDMILSVKVVSSVEEAVDHINFYGSRHSDGIIGKNAKNVAYFLNQVDSAVVYHNASTRFTDGGEFGMGAEIGISTDKLHARGPMGLAELNTYKYIVYGKGQCRN